MLSPDNTINPSNGARTTASDALQFVYDNRDQLQLERAVNPLVAVSTVLDHDYDLNGRATALATNLGGTISGSNITGGVKDLTNQYVWDALGRLTSVTQTSQYGGNSVAAKLATYQYDAASQLTDLRRYSSTIASSPFVVRWAATFAKGDYNFRGGPNRLTGWSSYADAFKTTYAEGNQIRRTKISDGKVTEYEYDYRNRLVKVTEKNSLAGPPPKSGHPPVRTIQRGQGSLTPCGATSTITSAAALSTTTSTSGSNQSAAREAADSVAGSV